MRVLGQEFLGEITQNQKLGGLHCLNRRLINIYFPESMKLCLLKNHLVGFLEVFLDVSMAGYPN